MVDISEKNFEQTIETILTQGTVVPQGGGRDMRAKQLPGLPDNLAVIASERRRKYRGQAPCSIDRT